ncbi:hypothetical protein HYFRA_00009968 [Hymenoscyphus fraxineus]|uniref:Major facilitator superfamily (MFS) profile domain-containing protein n=1 Tax=Hymenoscyphus fraxineus TaxID=746836 RepID=A0A9N9PTH6_9HELO|nr:hypothetical protein HYFRA_00009968 [Hymenoscyphus fraxineus]
MEKIESHHESPKADLTSDLKAEEHSLEANDEKSREFATTSVDSGGDNVKKTKEPEVEEWEYVTGFKLVAVISVITLACFILLLDTSIVATAIPKITVDFHSLNDVGWYGSSYLLATCALTPMSGKIYARFSTKYMYMCFTALFSLGSLICALSNSSNMFIVGRAIAGIGGSGLINGSLTILSACVPLEKRPVYMGFLMSFAQLGIMLGPLIGGALTEHATWRWCFWINLPPSALTILIIFLIHVPDQTAKRAERTSIIDTLMLLDVPGFLLFAPTSIMFLLALEWGGTKYPWGSATIIGLFCGAAGNLAIFMAWEYKRGDDAMIPWSMIRQKVVACSCGVNFFFFAGQIILSYYLAQYFQAVRGVSPTLSGVYLLPGIMSQMVLAIVSGVLVSKLGYYLPWSVASGVLATISYGLISTFDPDSSTGMWALLAIQNSVPQQDKIPIGMALVTFSQMFGGALFLSFAQTGFSSAMQNTLKEFAPEVSASTIANAGALGFRAVVPPSSVAGVIQAYNNSINQVFYIAAGCGVGSFLLSFGMGMKSIKKAKVVEPAA